MKSLIVSVVFLVVSSVAGPVSADCFSDFQQMNNAVQNCPQGDGCAFLRCTAEKLQDIISLIDRCPELDPTGQSRSAYLQSAQLTQSQADACSGEAAKENDDYASTNNCTCSTEKISSCSANISLVNEKTIHISTNTGKCARVYYYHDEQPTLTVFRGVTNEEWLGPGTNPVLRIDSCEICED